MVCPNGHTIFKCTKQAFKYYCGKGTFSSLHRFYMFYSAEIENDFVLLFSKLFELRVSYEKCHNVSLLKSIMIWSKFKDGMSLYVWF